MLPPLRASWCHSYPAGARRGAWRAPSTAGRTASCRDRALPTRRETSYNAWVTIQIGCDNRCAFCIVPSVRGKEISRPLSTPLTATDLNNNALILLEADTLDLAYVPPAD